MTKGALRRLGLSASKRLKHLQAAAEKAADELLEKSYAGAAEQTLRGAATVSKILHEGDEDIAKAKSAIASRPPAKKPARKGPKGKVSKRRKAVKRRKD